MSCLAITEKPQDANVAHQREIVILVHGFAGSPRMMLRLAKGLVRRNYDVRLWRYPSVRKSIHDHVDPLGNEIESLLQHGYRGPIHFVTHSMGGIVVRQTLTTLRANVYGRMVMLAPPNSGSYLARAGASFLGRLCPVLHEISTHPQSLVNAIGAPPQFEIGIIVASRDWVVRRVNTQLSAQCDSVIIRGGHLLLPFVPESLEQVARFLSQGCFRHDKHVA